MTMMACARIGAVHNVVFAGYSAEALAKRIIDSEAKVLVSAAMSYRGGKAIELFKIVAEAEKFARYKGTESRKECVTLTCPDRSRTRIGQRKKRRY